MERDGKTLTVVPKQDRAPDSSEFRVPYIGVILGLCWGYVGIMDKKMKTTIVYWGYIRVI